MSHVNVCKKEGTKLTDRKIQNKGRGARRPRSGEMIKFILVQVSRSTLIIISVAESRGRYSFSEQSLC